MSMKTRLPDGPKDMPGLVNQAKRTDEFATMPDNLVNHTQHKEVPETLKGTDKPC